MALADSETETGKRLSFIIVDNAVEFLMKAYVENETQSVGSGNVLKKSEWDDMKQNFRKLLDFVFKQFHVSNASMTDIWAYHNLRNDLYHGAKPLSVEHKQVAKYIAQFKLLLNDLQKFQWSGEQWGKKAVDVSQKIARKEAQAQCIIAYSSKNGKARFEKTQDVKLSDIEAIMLAIHLHMTYAEDEPSFEDLNGILTRSSHPLDKQTISKRVHDLKLRDLVLDGRLLLKSAGVDRLRKKFSIIVEPLNS